MDIQEQIIAQLAQIEREHHVRIPIVIESGSRAWGFASPDSDYDCRFIYVHSRDRYLSVFEEKDTIEFTPDVVFDIGGWDVRKVIQHLVKSNAVMLEWLSSGIVYRMDEAVRQELWVLGEVFFNPVAVCWHYLSMARNKLAEIEVADTAKIKKYFYVLRPLACIRYIHAHNRIPYMEYQRNLAEIPLAPDVKEQIIHLLKEKETAAEGLQIPRNEILLAYFREESAWAEEWLGGLRHEKNRDVTGMMRSFLERLLFMNLTYDDPYRKAPGKNIDSAFFFTMNLPKEAAQYYTPLFEQNCKSLGYLGGGTECLPSFDTYQFDDYSKYAAGMFDAAHKEQVRSEQFPLDCEKAFEIGKRLASNIKN